MSSDTHASPSGRRERKKALTRQLISDAATKLFQQSGFDHVTVKQIADLADVSPTTVFTYFPTKESLVFDEEPAQEAALVGAVRDRPAGTSVLDALEDHLANGDRMFDKRPSPDFQAFLDLVNGTPALREHERRMLIRREKALADAIATSSGPQVSPTASAALARFVLGAYDIARDHPEPRIAFCDAIAILRKGWHEE